MYEIILMCPMQSNFMKRYSRTENVLGTLTKITWAVAENNLQFSNSRLLSYKLQHDVVLNFMEIRTEFING